MADWRALQSMAYFTKDYASHAKTSQVESIAQSLTDSAVDSSDFSAGFGSKIYYLAEHVVRRDLFGEKLPLPATDLTLLRRGAFITPVVLGIDPIVTDGKTPRSLNPNAWGFYSMPLRVISAKDLPEVEKTVTLNLQWQQKERPFYASASIGRIPPEEIVPRDSAASIRRALER